ncbi:MAG: DNA repair protein RecO [Flavobacteriaceae bacterium]|nr:DNA repair protein RecO [Bacteroidia bacterium]NNK82820.1 DNA repair protein RecO [Flavobacteriaceae bacterium]
MLTSTKAIVLSKLKFRDNDLIVKCYSNQYGIISFLLKGVLKSKKGKFKIAYFQELTLLDLEIDYRDTRSLQYIKEIKLSNHFYSIHTNVVKSTIAMFLSELLSNILKEEEQNVDLFKYIETALIWFDQSETETNFHLMFLIELTKYLGFYPNLNNFDSQFFNLEFGQFQNSETGNYCIKGEKLNFFKTLLGIKFDSNNKLTISNTHKRELLDMILVYFNLHLDGFKKPKSLEVLNQVFNT